MRIGSLNLQERELPGPQSWQQNPLVLRVQQLLRKIASYQGSARLPIPRHSLCSRRLPFGRRRGIFPAQQHVKKGLCEDLWREGAGHLLRQGIRLEGGFARCAECGWRAGQAPLEQHRQHGGLHNHRLWRV